MSRSLAFLTLGLLAFGPMLAPAAADEVLKVNGQLSENDPNDPVRMKPAKIHEVKLVKGKAYQIDLMAKDFDAYLRLVNAAGVEVATDDDGGDGLNSRIKYTPNEDQTFKIYVTTFAGGTGNYILKVEGPDGKGGAVTGGEVVLSIAGKIQAADNRDPVRQQPGKVHEVKLKKGTSYQLDLMSDSFDAYMRLEDEAGREIAKDDDGGDRLNSRIKITAEKDGAYKIFATTFNGGEGDYTLSVRAVGAANVVAGAVELPAPAAGKPAQHVGQLQMNDPADPVRQRPAKLYTVELKAGKTYVIDLMSAQFDCFLRLETADGKQLAQDDDGGEGLNSRIRFQCTTDGRYRLYAAALGVGQGQFNIVVTEQ